MSEPISPKRVRTVHLQQFKDAGQKFSMLTAYDAQIASIFDEAGIELLLVGDSASSVMMGHSSTLPITVDEMLVFTTSVVNGAHRALVVADLPFGSYEASPAQAVATGVRFMKEAGAQAVKIEGDAAMTEHVRAMVAAGIPVIAHIGFTPQAEHALGGYRVQGRGDTAQALIDDALALEGAGAFCVLMEMVPAELATQVDRALRVPTIGIGAGSGTTGQVLVWQDMLGLGSGRVPRFVKQYANLREVVGQAAAAYREDVSAGTFPAPEHSFEG
ncbi:3-methyl-2-oxobutanoate hydroxymethyltransferase [Nesterenkonia sp. E16_7]|uniref:3-methyl-2-oxobutanoate hydroxymethyltransferase n=1 Tax=unclassified Nesterenkonia TaxID=2629769 RepID=UPI001A90D1F3|nr:MULTISPECIES: 3-methyl-2-oxobutanoate hydroxymethyltransferase [unclassified Nesterenkonia]MBO0595826.1 3-methyl-2-oxobutanoate hydroxymethyltransferase [Nesterenkonia sp. E16_10]MBO0599575.1 3-methyl-2-oxobutanoate hydroxymethyltransferase [Nesterenkonia sp. E16_7]